jgi:DNA modification methylase
LGELKVDGVMILPEEAPAPCAAELAVMGLKEPGKTKRNKAHSYTVDFVYYENGRMIAEDVKGVKTADYILRRDKLPKFRNNGRMVFNCLPMANDNETPKIHPTQKPIGTIKHLIETLTDPGDVIIDLCAGSGITLLAANELGRRSYGFEIKKEYCKQFESILKRHINKELFTVGAEC